jgi:hypothetical protein
MKRLRQTENVDLRIWRLEIRFLFRILSLVHGLTKRTRMRAIKCLSDRGAKGHVLGKLNDHRCPSHRLHGKPMQTDRATQRKYRDDAAGARKHNAQASYRVINVNAVEIAKKRVIPGISPP